MLVGNEKSLKQLMDQAYSIADKENFSLVFAAVQGSISRGLQRYDSDYDIRFLYKRKQFPYVDGSKAWSEKNVVFRYYPQQETFFDKIAFWDIEAFVSFLVKPELDQKGISVGLYNQFFWTFSSPYTWDPFGIAGKLMALANTVINKKWLTDYLIDYIQQLICKETLYLRDSIYCVLGIWQLMWLHKYNSYPPLDYYTLKYISDDTSITKIVDLYVLQLKGMKNETFIRKGFTKVPIEHNAYLDRWIEEKLSYYHALMLQLKGSSTASSQVITCLNEILFESFKEKEVHGII